jgi:hypothetical protein
MELRYSSTLSLTSELYWGEWSTPRPGRFTPGKTRYPLCRRLGGPQRPCGRVRKISPPPGFDPRTVRPVASRCTDWAVPAHGVPVVLSLTDCCRMSCTRVHNVCIWKKTPATTPEGSQCCEQDRFCKGFQLSRKDCVQQFNYFRKTCSFKLY